MGLRKKKHNIDGVKLAKLVDSLIRAAELLFPIPKSGKERREWVISEINGKINIPLMGEKTEGQVIGLLVDFACETVKNIRSGKE
tara:strand:+ start:122 stop:376 length:255 start_codon:yes stop_codon:yes gene_type:complete